MSGNEKRLHRRIGGIVAENASVQFAFGKKFILKNISYGGFSIESVENGEIFSDSKSYPCTLRILGQSVETEARLVSLRGNHVGFAIVHSGIDALIFLRGIFEFWQNGLSARIVNSDRNKLTRADLGQIYINGDGPTDMILTPKAAGECPDVIITFMSDGDYSQVEFSHGILKSGKAFGESKMPGASVRMDSVLDAKAVRQAICLLAGFDIHALKSDIDKILKLWINALG